jgi:hypothetical protein
MKNNSCSHASVSCDIISSLVLLDHVRARCGARPLGRSIFMKILKYITPSIH